MLWCACMLRGEITIAVLSGMPNVFTMLREKDDVSVCCDVVCVAFRNVPLCWCERVLCGCGWAVLAHSPLLQNVCSKGLTRDSVSSLKSFTLKHTALRTVNPGLSGADCRHCLNPLLQPPTQHLLSLCLFLSLLSAPSLTQERSARAQCKIELQNVLQ